MRQRCLVPVTDIDEKQGLRVMPKSCDTPSRFPYAQATFIGIMRHNLERGIVRQKRLEPRFADAVRPAPRPLPDAQTEELRALLTRRRQLIAMRTAEQNRLGSAP